MDSLGEAGARTRLATPQSAVSWLVETCAVAVEDVRFVFGPESLHLPNELAIQLNAKNGLGTQLITTNSSIKTLTVWRFFVDFKQGAMPHNPQELIKQFYESLPFWVRATLEFIEEQVEAPRFRVGVSSLGRSDRL